MSVKNDKRVNTIEGKTFKLREDGPYTCHQEPGRWTVRGGKVYYRFHPCREDYESTLFDVLRLMECVRAGSHVEVLSDNAQV